MSVFLCRWPNGDSSFVSARNRDEALLLLDEMADTEGAELHKIPKFMVHFTLEDNGELALEDFGEESGVEIRERAYPILNPILAKIDGRKGPPRLTDKKAILAAVELERKRLKAEPLTKLTQ